MSVPGRKHMEKDGFRLRGIEVSRIDAFSDVVFGFALTLLVVSLEVPKSYSELHEMLRGFAPFAICFYMLMSVWYAHYKFFRRFGLHDMGTIWINSILLFVVLFYVYPLKFLFTLVTSLFMPATHPRLEDQHQVTELMVIYAVGYFAIYALISLLYWNGLRQRHHLELNELEVMLTRSYIGENLGMALIGMLSGAVAWLLPAYWAGYAGWVYVLITPLKIVYGQRTRRETKRINTRLQLDSVASEDAETI